MSTQVSRSVRSALAVAAVGASTLAQHSGDALDVAQEAREQIHARMLGLAREISSLRASFGSAARVERLNDEYRALSFALGGNDPANAQRIAGVVEPEPSAPNGPLALVNPACGATPTTKHVDGTGGLIVLGVTPTNYTCVVSGLGTYLWDVDVNSSITHDGCGDLDVTLTSPSGTKVTLTSDNGGTLDNVFNGTTWNDNVNDPASDKSYTNLVTATPLSPEGRLTAFRGENPNGTWTLTVADDLITNTGTLTAWSLDLRTASAPTTTTTSFSDSPNIPISAGGSASYPDTQVVGGVGASLVEVKLYLEVTHSAPRDLDITLTPPSGPAVRVSTDNGGQNADVFDGTTFDPGATVAVTDAVYADGVVLLTCSPEGSFDNWLGINPNGTWTLNVADDNLLAGGTFKRWDLMVTTSAAATTPSSPSHFNGTTGAFPDAGSGGPNTVMFTVPVSGAGTYLFDVDLNTAISHPACDDLDITLTSPAGTTLAVSTDNGLDESFGNTRFDDNVNAPVSDVIFTAGQATPALSPEGRLSAFRGENPNGTWTLTIADDTVNNGGTLNSWSLDLASLPAAPGASTLTFSATPNLPLADVGTVADTQSVAGAGPLLSELKLYTEITHTWCEDLEVTLTSPAGTVVVVTTDNASNFNDVYNGTLFDPGVADSATDHAYADLVVATPLGPEGSFDVFNGQNPNGTWTLTITDDEAQDIGTLVRWDLQVTTCTTNIAVIDCQTRPTATQSCQSTASFTGQPSDAGAPFTITFGGLNVQVNGVVFYGITGPVSLPWSPQSMLCCKSPTQRLSVPGASGNTGGTAGNCNGSYSFDMNAIIQGSGLLGTPMTQGTSVNIQAWQRDTASIKTTNLSDALRFVVGP